MPDQRKYLSKLEGQRVFILGGSSGIGLAVAEACLEYGAHVTISSSNQSRITESLARLRSLYPSASKKITGMVCDISNPDRIEYNIQAALAYAASHSDDYKLDHIIYTATTPLAPRSLGELNAENVRSDARFTGALFTAKHAETYMRKSHNSSITFTGGLNSDKPAPGWTLIVGNVAGVEGLVRALALELKPIRVNIVSPGLIDTPLVDKIPEAEKYKESVREKMLTGTIGQAEDCAEAYLYLMKDRFVTGTKIATNGGALLI